MWDWLKDIWQAIIDIPSLILNGIVDIFIPDAEYIEEKFNEFLEDMKRRFGIDTGMFEGLFSSEKPVEDIYVDYSLFGIGNFHLKVFDTSFFVDGVTYFRPFIRGFLVLMMLLYHVKQCISFFGYDSGVVTGRSEHIAEAKKGQRE